MLGWECINIKAQGPSPAYKKPDSSNLRTSGARVAAADERVGFLCGRPLPLFTGLIAASDLASGVFSGWDAGPLTYVVLSSAFIVTNDVIIQYTISSHPKATLSA